jgi:hypothetical protein
MQLAAPLLASSFIGDLPDFGTYSVPDPLPGVRTHHQVDGPSHRTSDHLDANRALRPTTPLLHDVPDAMLVSQRIAELSPSAERPPA